MHSAPIALHPGCSRSTSLLQPWKKAPAQLVALPPILTLDLAHRHSSPPASRFIPHCTAAQPSLPAVSLSTASGTFSTGHSLPAPLSPAASAHACTSDPQCTSATKSNGSNRPNTASLSGHPVNRSSSALPAHRAFPFPSSAPADPSSTHTPSKNSALAHPLRRLPSLPPAVRRKVAMRERERERRVCTCLAEYDDADTTSSDGTSEVDEEEQLGRMNDEELGLAGGDREEKTQGGRDAESAAESGIVRDAGCTAA